jgi:hypothetical protein
MQDMSPSRKNRSQHRSADKRAILRDHYLFVKLTAQQIESLRDFLPLIREEPEIALKIIEILCSKLRRTTEQASLAVAISV